MKRDFFDYMVEVMRNNPNVYIIFIDLGFPRVDEFLTEFRGRAFTVGASEQTACDMAVGFALSGKIPVLYTIASFYWRGAETIRTYFNVENLPCILVGAGVKEEYGHEDGPSHSATDMPELFNIFKNFKQHYPDTKEELITAIDDAISNGKPNFVNIHR